MLVHAKFKWAYFKPDEKDIFSQMNGFLNGAEHKMPTVEQCFVFTNCHFQILDNGIWFEWHHIKTFWTLPNWYGVNKSNFNQYWVCAPCVYGEWNTNHKSELLNFTWSENTQNSEYIAVALWSFHHYKCSHLQIHTCRFMYGLLLRDCMQFCYYLRLYKLCKIKSSELTAWKIGR